MMAVKYAREHGVPYLGICLGMQVAVIEFARNKAGLSGANSTEFDKKAKDPVIALITEWQDVTGRIEQRDESSDLGGTMRLGGQQCKLIEGTKVRELYDKDIITERHRNRYEFNNNYRDALINAGLKVAGTSVDGKLARRGSRGAAARTGFATRAGSTTAASSTGASSASGSGSSGSATGAGAGAGAG